MKIAGKVAIVTGSSRGVGRATAIELAAGGCAVAVNYASSKDAAEAVVEEIRAAGGKAIAVKADVANDAECRALVETTVEQFGGLDILVNNAGTTSFIPHSDLDAVDDAVWQGIFGVNLIGPFQCIRAAKPYLDAAGDAEIVNVASIAGLHANGSSIPYAASKAGLINMGMALARVLAPTTRLNTVAPGFIEGEWLRQGIGEHYDMVKEAIEASSTLGKVSQPEDIAAAILSLITGSDQVTAQTLVVDGGQLNGPKFS